ncbi:MAG TPA: fibronectin type III domain-containing protein [Vicinamibacterales bacterium]|nr:fibronectin type III domain-containing protein [Vicinamibacterales bacterium]
MSRRHLVRASLLIGLMLAATTASAQPTAWSSQRYYHFGFRYFLSVRDLGTRASLAFLEAPPGVELGPGALTPEGRYYLLTTNLGLARFTTTPPAFDRLLGPAVMATAIYVPPAGTSAHLIGDFGHAVLDWETGIVERITCCASPVLAFTPDGALRIEVESTGVAPAVVTSVTVVDSANDQVRWTREFAGAVGSGIGVSALHLAVSIGDDVIVWDVVSGTEEGRIGHRLSSRLDWRGDSLVAQRTLPTSIPGQPPLERLSIYTLPTLAESVVLEQPYIPGRVEPIGIHFSADGRYVYWLDFVSWLGLSVSSTTYSVFDLDETRWVASGSLGLQRQDQLALEAAQQCVFSVPDNLTVPAQGAVVDIPVVPTPNCRPWSAPGAMNPGPHTGAATIRTQVDANIWSQPQTVTQVIGGTAATIAQAAAPPAAVDLRVGIEGDRVRLTWMPGVGAGVRWFDVQGALLGAAPAVVATLPSSAREWVSPSLSPGSYVVEVTARNDAGSGPESNSVAFSIGAQALPDAPTDLDATVVDDQVTLTWRPAASAPAPSGYVVEASAAGGSGLVPMARTTGPRLYATRVPAGSWQVRVRAETSGGAGAASPIVTLAPAGCAAPPGPPQAPWPLTTFPSFTLRWAVPLAGSVDEYVIEVGSTTGASDIARAVVGGAETAVTVPQVSANALAFARVLARNACGESAPSLEVVVLLP